MADKEYITSDLAKERMKAINIVAQVQSKAEPRDVKGGQYRVCDCVLSDAKGTIDLTLWGDDIGKVNANDIVRITNGYINEFKDKKSLQVGKFGKLEIVQQANA